MSLGSTLIELQELDLGLMRDKAELADMPELADLAKKRRVYLKLKADEKRLFAERKDIETDLSDMDARERACTEEEERVRADAATAGFRDVQDIEIRLSDIAKELDKIAYARRHRLEDLKSHETAERKLQAYLAALEDAIKQGTREARGKAGDLQARVTDAEHRRPGLVRDLGPEMAARYDAACERFRGLAVERLEGEVPSVCRTALQPASLSGLARAGEVGECPYCHRILVLSRDGE